MKEIKVKLTVDSSEAKKGVDDVTNSAKKLDKEVGDVNKSTNNLGGSIDTMTGGALSGFKKFATGLKTVALGFRTIGGAIAASGIGLIVITIAALTAAFQGSEEGQNKFAKIMGVIGAVTGNLVDLLADLGEKIIGVFENPKQAIKDFANLIKTNITNRFDGLMELIPALGTAISQLFSGEFKAAAKTAGNAVAKVALGVDDLSGKIKAATDATKDFVKQNINEGNAAARVADQRAKADKIERGLLVRRAIAEREIAKLRLKAKDLNNVSAEERQAALKEVLSIQDGLAESEVEIATLRSSAQTAENGFARSTKENLLEEERLKAAVIAVETKRIDQKRQIQRELTAAENELNAKVKAATALEKANQKIQDAKDIADAKAKIALKKKIAEFSAISEQEQRDLEKEKLRANFEELMEQLKEDEDAKLELTKSYLEKQKELTNKFTEEDALKTKENSDKEIAEAKAVADAKAAIQDQGLKVASQAFSLLGQLGEDNKALQATALIGESGIGIAKMIIANNTANIAALATPQAVASSGASAAPVIAFNNISTALGVAATVAATAKGLAALGEGGAPAGGDAGAGGATAPAFNLVEGTESNAIQDSITNQDTAIKAIVVSGDVTTAQSADRNAIDSSGF